MGQLVPLRPGDTRGKGGLVVGAAAAAAGGGRGGIAGDGMAMGMAAMGGGGGMMAGLCKFANPVKTHSA
jgi:hypothetical protein